MIDALLVILPVLWAAWRLGPLDYDGRPIRGKRNLLAGDDDEDVE